MLVHYHWNLVIYLCYIICVIVIYILYYCTVYHNYSPTHLSTALPLSHESWAKASDLRWLRFDSDPKLSKFFRSEALHRSSSVGPAGCFQDILFKQTGACHWNKFGSKCDAFGADMSSRTFAPGRSCSKVPVLRIGFVNHHRDYWAQCNMC